MQKSQKVNLNEISITLLADQFLEFIKNSDNLNLESALNIINGNMVSLFKTKLLLPEEDDEDKLRNAEKLKLQLKKLELIRLLSDQL